MSKDSINIKSNGLRNELKEIRKSIDKLTDAIKAQTNTRYEKHNSYFDSDDFMRINESYRKTSKV